MLLRTRPEAAARPAVDALLDRVRPEHLALSRVGAGAVMVLRPRALPQGLGVDSATAARTAWVVQMLGVRDAALGIGTYASLRSGDGPGSRLWLRMGVLSDAVDALAVAAAVARGRVSKGAGAALVAVALSAVALGARALQEDEADI